MESTLLLNLHRQSAPCESGEMKSLQYSVLVSRTAECWCLTEEKWIYMNQNRTKVVWEVGKRWKRNHASGKCDLCVFESHFSPLNRSDGDKLPSRLRFCWHVFKNNLWRFGFTFRTLDTLETSQSMSSVHQNFHVHPTWSHCIYIFRLKALWTFTSMKRKFHYLINISHCYFNINIIINQIIFPP